jgi:hypothetical protein
MVPALSSATVVVVHPSRLSHSDGGKFGLAASAHVDTA